MRISHSIIAVAFALAACGKTSSAPKCPSSFDDLKGTPPQTCSCDGASTIGTVWGTDIYTSDSSICAAAKHDGLSGDVTVDKADGCSSYVASTKNGITTEDWGPHPGSFYFTSSKKPACPAPK
jgi:hypothetical protein